MIFRIPTRRLNIYSKVCKRCNQVHKTTSRTSGSICEECNIRLRRKRRRKLLLLKKN